MVCHRASELDVSCVHRKSFKQKHQLASLHEESGNCKKAVSKPGPGNEATLGSNIPSIGLIIIE